MRRASEEYRGTRVTVSERLESRHLFSTGYIVTDLGPSVTPNAISDNGTVAGMIDVGAGVTHAFYYDGETHDLGTLPGGTSSWANGVNDSNQVVGASVVGGKPRAFLYDGTFKDLGTLPGTDSSEAKAINNTGTIVGYSGVLDDPIHAFLYDGTLHDVDPGLGTRSFATAISHNGIYAGDYVANGMQRGFVFDGTSHDVGTLGGTYTFIDGVNDSGQAVGGATYADVVTHSGQAAIFYDGTIYDLGDLGRTGGGANAFGINDSGTIVGSAATASNVAHAFVYQNGTMKDLNDLLPTNSRRELAGASAINDGGQIVGTDTAMHGFLLTPATFIQVTTTADSGSGSLRQAIENANATPGTVLIEFAIPGTGVHTISPATPLPPVTNSVVIDGTTQPDFVAKPLIELRGPYIGGGTGQMDFAGLTLAARGGGVRGLIINGFSAGILVTGSGNIVQGNYLGTDATGTRALGNSYGIAVRGRDNRVGGAAAGAGNLISGNNIGLYLGSATKNVIQGNWIGIDVLREQLGNSGDGVRLDGGAADNTVGGTATSDMNTIAYNGGAGISIMAADSIGNAISGNSIHDNGGLGIDLNGDGVTPNATPPRTGPNQLQNYPELAWASTRIGRTKVSGRLIGAARTEYHLEFFASPTADPSGYGEGSIFLGTTTTTTDATGAASFLFTAQLAVPVGQVVAATATDPAGDTSEFSKAVPVSAQLYWTGAGDGVSWGDARNWSSDTIPTVMDDTVIRNPLDRPILLSGPQGVRTLALAGTLRLGIGAVFHIVYGAGSDPVSSIRAGLFAGSIASAVVGKKIAYSDANGELILRPALIGDANQDGQVTFADLLIFAQNYGRTAATWDEGDFNYDGVVGFDDLLLLAESYPKRQR